jgi:hypothetical protein
LDSDIVRLYELNPPPDANGKTKKHLVATLFWGDTVRITKKTTGGSVVRLARKIWNPETRKFDDKVYDCLLPSKVKLRDEPLLKVRFVDVGQGDGAVIETPKGRIVLVDGGEEDHLRRYVMAAYSHLLAKGPLACSAIVVTHGDADHYAGLTRLVNAKGSKGGGPVLTAERVFHNGIVKGESKSANILGRTVKKDGTKYVVALEDDVRQVPDSRMNGPMRAWKAALESLRTSTGKRPVVKRVKFGDDSAFDFLKDEGIRVRVLGPVTDSVNGGDALPWLGDASHTINGHSVVLKVELGNVRFLMGADLNEPSEERLLTHTSAQGLSLTSEVLKVPHHGSADFSPRMLDAVRPVVSVISSGDESGGKEYIHPRAGLVGALGKYSRATVEKPLVYVTEMVAFFKRLPETPTLHNGYQKTAFGIVHVRTDGKRVLVVTHSGKDDQKESYAFTVDEIGQVTFEPEVKPI